MMLTSKISAFSKDPDIRKAMEFGLSRILDYAAFRGLPAGKSAEVLYAESYLQYAEDYLANNPVVDPAIRKKLLIYTLAYPAIALSRTSDLEETLGPEIADLYSQMQTISMAIGGQTTLSGPVPPLTLAALQLRFDIESKYLGIPTSNAADICARLSGDDLEVAAIAGQADSGRIHPAIH